MTNEILQQAFKTTLIHYWLTIAVVVLCAVFSIRSCIKEGGTRKGDQWAATGILLVVLGILILFDTTIPLTKEYRRQEIMVVEGMYEKPKNQGGGRRNRAMDLETVYIETEDKTIVLTTYPWNNDAFPDGTVPAIAYYTPETKFLLHIEIQK